MDKEKGSWLTERRMGVHGGTDRSVQGRRRTVEELVGGGVGGAKVGNLALRRRQRRRQRPRPLLRLPRPLLRSPARASRA